MIKLVNVTMSFGNKHVLEGVSLEVAEGETMVIIGPSGSGKSTLLRLIVGLMKPSDGEIWIDNQEISRLGEAELNRIRLNMGMVFQYSALFDFMSVGENVAFGLRQHTTMTEEQIARVVRRKLQMVGLSGQENVMPNELSGGMKKRVSLARATAIDPKIILYDEPTAGLDPIMSNTIDQMIVSTQRIMGVTSVVVTHQMSSAFNIADRIAMIYEGRIVEVGTVEQIRNSENEIVRRFICGQEITAGINDRRRNNS
ncbi:MAG: ABC transporter ATP-binding protein [Veillonellales bacterium]